MPLIPQYDAGPRIEPPVSEPSPPSTRPAQTAVPVPELDPPGVRAGSHGFLAIGKPVAGSGQPIANSCNTVLPISTAPASRSFRTVVASVRCPHDWSKTRLFAVVGASLVASR